MKGGFDFLDFVEDDKEVDVESFDRKSVRREKEYKITKASKNKKRAFNKDFRY